MKIAVETYANLTNQTAKQVMQQCLYGNKVVIEIIQKLMFSVA